MRNSLKFKLCLLLFFLMVLFSFGIQGQNRIDSLKNELTLIHNIEEKIKVLNDISWEIAPTDYQQSVYYAEEALKLGQSKYPELEAESYTCLGSANDLHGKYEAALQFYQKSFEIYKRMNQKEGEAKVLLNIGASYYYRGVYAQALNYYLQALQIQEQLSDHANLAKTYNNIGLVYRTKKENRKALDMFSKSMKIKELIKDKKGMLYTYSNIGIIYQNENRCDSAIVYAQKSLDLANELKSDYEIGTSLTNLAEAYFCKGDLTLAKKYFLMAEKILLVTQNDNTLAFCYKGLGNVAFKERNSVLAIDYFQLGIKFAKATERNELLIDLYHSLYEIYLNQGKSDLALTHYQMYVQTKDSVFSIESNRNINELAIVYETQKQEERLKEKEQEQKRLRYYIIALGIGLVLVMLSVYIVNKQRHKLAGQKKILETLVDEKNILLRETHHRVKNNFQIVSGLLYLQSENVVNKSAKEALHQAQNRVKSMIFIHQKLYNKEELIGVNVREYLTDLIHDLTEYQEDNIKGLNTNLNIDELVFDVDTITPLGLIVNELITNILKHAFDQTSQNPLIQLTLKRVDQAVQLTVSDNGKGFKTLSREHSFGMELIQSLVQKLKGTIQYENKNGTTVHIVFKKYKLF